jgi:hypothetical protein
LGIAFISHVRFWSLADICNAKRKSGHESPLGGQQNDILVAGNENEIYGHFTCDDEAEQFQ